MKSIPNRWRSHTKCWQEQNTKKRDPEVASLQNRLFFLQRITVDPSRWTFSLTLVLHQYVISFGRTGIRSSSYQCICIRPYSEKAMFDVALVLAKIFLFVKHWKKLHNCNFFLSRKQVILLSFHRPFLQEFILIFIIISWTLVQWVIFQDGQLVDKNIIRFMTKVLTEYNDLPPLISRNGLS